VPGNLHPKQVARIEAPQFEIEVEAEAEGAWIRIPESVVESDPRGRCWLAMVLKQINGKVYVPKSCP